MEFTPTTDPDFKVKPTRPGWKAVIGFLAFVGGIAVFVSMVEI